MIEKIKRRKENNFTISHAEQHHRKKGKDKNKRKKNGNFFKDIYIIENNSIAENYYTNDHISIRDIFEKINQGEEVKVFNIEIVKKVLNKRRINDKIGSYQFDNGIVLDILTYYDNKKVFLIRKELI